MGTLLQVLSVTEECISVPWLLVFIIFQLTKAQPKTGMRLAVALKALGSHNACLCPLSPVELQKKPVEGFSAGLIDDDDIYQWEVMIMGPPDTF